MTEQFRFRAPGAAQPAHRVLAWAFPGVSADTVEGWIDAGWLLCAGSPVRSRLEPLPPAALLGLELERPPDLLTAWPALRLIGHSAYVLVPASPWRCGRVPLGHGAGTTTSEPAQRESVAFEQLDEPLDEAGDVIELRVTLERDGEDRAGEGTRGEGTTEDAAVTGVGASGAPRRTEDLSFRKARQVLDALARAGLTVLGDVWNGGRVVGPGPAWRSAAAGSHREAGVAPEAPLFVAAPASGFAHWVVSDATAAVLARGHPWIRPDAQSEEPDRFRPGQRVEVVGPGGRPLGQALVDGPGAVSGRLVSRPGESGWSVEASVARALKRRRDFFAHLDRTDAFRLVHAEADGLPGLFVDRLGPLVRVLVTARGALSLVDRALQALAPAIPDPWRIVEVLHLDERSPGRFERVRVHPWSLDEPGARELGTRMCVREAGLEYQIAPGLAEPDRGTPGFGLFLDQRENRARFMKRARRGGRYLNLFAHTGAFSVALLAGGAERVESVDLSAAYLRWLEDNLERNRAAGVDPDRHVSIRQDGRRLLERLPADACFDGIVLDPPTAAAAGRQFFSVRRDLVPMVGRCLSVLAPGGLLLLTSNDRKARLRLDDAVTHAADEVGVELASIEPATPARDFPRLEGFAEGDAFRGCWIERAGA